MDFTLPEGKSAAAEPVPQPASLILDTPAVAVNTVITVDETQPQSVEVAKPGLPGSAVSEHQPAPAAAVTSVAAPLPSGGQPEDSAAMLVDTTKSNPLPVAQTSVPVDPPVAQLTVAAVEPAVQPQPVPQAPVPTPTTTPASGSPMPTKPSSLSSRRRAKGGSSADSGQSQSEAEDASITATTTTTTTTTAEHVQPGSPGSGDEAPQTPSNKGRKRKVTLAATDKNPRPGKTHAASSVSDSPVPSPTDPKKSSKKKGRRGGRK